MLISKNGRPRWRGRPTNSSKMKELSSLVEDLQEAATQRNIFVHSVWHEIEGDLQAWNARALQLWRFQAILTSTSFTWHSYGLRNDDHR